MDDRLFHSGTIFEAYLINSLQTIFWSLISHFTVEPWYNEPPYNEVLGITNDLVYPSNSKIYGKVPRYNETSL